jgi:hypothetical protein
VPQDDGLLAVQLMAQQIEPPPIALGTQAPLWQLELVVHAAPSGFCIKVHAPAMQA